MAATSLQPDRPAALRLSFLPDPRSARAAAAVIRGFLTEQGIPEKDLFACELCVAEACNNAFEYARPAERNYHPIADAVCTEGEIELRVTDRSTGFDLPERAEAVSPAAERGRGLFIIRSMMDEVSYLRGSPENVLVMRKRRQRDSGSAALKAPLSAPELAAELTDCKRTIAGMARELCFRTETLSAVFRCCAELGRGGEAKDFANRLLSDLLNLTSGDWYVFRLLSAQDHRLHVETASHPELQSGPISLPAADGSPRGIEATAAATLTPARVDLRGARSNGSAADEPLLAAGAEADGLVHPLCFAGTLVGTLAVGRRRGGFSAGELQTEVVRTFAEFLALQTLNLRRREEELRDRVVVREMEIAQEIQRSLLPLDLPQLPGYGLTGAWQSAREVGGDFYDALVLNDRSLLLLVADVMGKGVPAALFATIMRGALRGLVARSDDPAELLRGLNSLLYPELSRVNMFITAQVVQMDLRNRRIQAASAGHCPLIFSPPGHAAVSVLPTRGLPLGVLPNSDYRTETGVLGRPGTLLLYTDGLTDARNPAGEMFGQRRLMDWMRAQRRPQFEAAVLGKQLLKEVNRFRGDAPMGDDQAFMLLTADEMSARAAVHAWWQARLVRRSLPRPAFSEPTAIRP